MISKNAKGDYEVMSYPVRTHSHVASIDPVVYTYRNPIESYMSLMTRLQDTDQKDNIAHEILRQVDVMAALRRDEMKGRSVVWLRYEDYYDKLPNRISAIAEFMNISVSPSQIQEIVSKTNISINLKRSKQYRSVSVPFIEWEDKPSGMQGNHINEHTMGIPGAYIEQNSETYHKIMQAPPRSELALIRTMATQLGY